jgi:hypothetical protein
MKMVATDDLEGRATAELPPRELVLLIKPLVVTWQLKRPAVLRPSAGCDQNFALEICTPLAPSLR